MIDMFDPPADNAALEDWQAFRSDVEAALKADPDSITLQGYLEMADEIIKEKKDSGAS